jgi:hypothetical protein
MPKPLQYLPVYVAEVTETDLGDAGRNVKAANEFLPDTAGEIAPALDGLMKLPAPKVGEKILVMQVDSSNLHRYYIPIRSQLNQLSDTNSKVQIEGEGDVEIKGGGPLFIEGSEIKVGEGASEAAVLGDELKSKLTDIINEIIALQTIGNLGAPAPVSPATSVAVSAIAAQLASILSTKVKVE